MEPVRLRKESSVERLPFEIFEIGAVKLDENRKNIGISRADPTDRL